MKSIILFVVLGVTVATNYGSNFNYGANYATGSGNYGNNFGYGGLSGGFSNVGYGSNSVNSYQGYGKGVYSQVVVPHPYPYPVPVPTHTGSRIIAVRDNTGPLGNIFDFGGNGIFGMYKI